MFPGHGDGNAFGALANHWGKIFEGAELEGIMPHVLLHSFASVVNDLEFTEITIAALMAHARRVRPMRSELAFA